MLTLHMLKRRKQAAQKSRFLAFKSSPFNLGSVGASGNSPNSLKMPASGMIGISYSAGLAAGQITALTTRGRSIKTPALAANQIFKIGYMESGNGIKLNCLIAGTAKLYYLDEWNRPMQIATGVFT